MRKSPLLGVLAPPISYLHKPPDDHRIVMDGNMQKIIRIIFTHVSYADFLNIQIQFELHLCKNVTGLHSFSLLHFSSLTSASHTFIPPLLSEILLSAPFPSFFSTHHSPTLFLHNLFFPFSFFLFLAPPGPLDTSVSTYFSPALFLTSSSHLSLPPPSSCLPLKL